MYDLRKHKETAHTQPQSVPDLKDLDLAKIAEEWKELGFEDASIAKATELRSNSGVWSYYLINETTGHAVCKTCQARLVTFEFGGLLEE